MTDLTDDEKVIVGKLASQLKIPRAEAKRFYQRQKEARKDE